VAQDHAGISLHFHVAHRVALDLRKVADLALGKSDVLDLARRQLLARRLDLGA